MKKLVQKAVSCLTIALAPLEMAFAQERTACNVRALLDAQRNRLGTETSRVRLSDGSSFINPFYHNQYPANDLDRSPTATTSQETVPAVGSPAPTAQPTYGAPRTSADAARLFEQVKVMMIDEILRQSTNLSPTQELMIRRIRNLQFRVEQNCVSPAWNAQPTQSVHICDRLLRHPAYSLIAILSHEIGHSLDFCGMSCRNYERVEPLRNLSTHFRTAAVSPEVQSYRQQLDSVPGSSGLIVQQDHPEAQQRLITLWGEVH